jgi:hypothetical protein
MAVAADFHAHNIQEQQARMCHRQSSALDVKFFLSIFLELALGQTRSNRFWSFNVLFEYTLDI